MVSELHENLSGVLATLNSTPMVEPYYSEVGRAINHLEHGDLTDNPLYEIIHGHLSARAMRGDLPTQDWIVTTLPGGRIVAHRQFLEIQNRFSELEMGQAKEIKWNADETMESFKDYIGILKKYRGRHSLLFDKVTSMFDVNERETILKIASQVFPHMISSMPSEIVLIAIPSHLDNPELWSGLGISTPILDRIPTYVKINEAGVILASANYRDDKLHGRGHDYFSYAARSVVDRQVKTMTQRLSLTAQHEGSHWISDALLSHLLAIGAQNPIYEGLPGALGEDGREFMHTNITLNQLLENGVEDINGHDSCYIAGPKIFKSIHKIISERYSTDANDSWSRIISESLRVGLQIKTELQSQQLTEAEKVSTFFRGLIRNLKIPAEEVEKVYESLN